MNKRNALPTPPRSLLRTRLFPILFALAALPVAGVGWLFYGISLQSVQSVLARQSLDAAQGGVARIAAAFPRMKTESSMPARSRTVRLYYRDQAGQNSILDQQTANQKLQSYTTWFLDEAAGHYVQVIYLDAAGEPLFKYETGQTVQDNLDPLIVPAFEPGDRSGRPLSGEKLRISVQKTASHGAVLRFARPVQASRTSKQVLGYLLLDVPLEQLLPQRTSGDISLLLADRTDGQVLYAADKRLPGRPLAEVLPELAQTFERTANDSSGSINFTYHQEAHLASYVILAEPAWTVAAIIATEPYTAGPRRIGFYTLAATALFVLVSGSLIFLLVRRVQGRTAELEAANLHLERENAVERIRAQVFSMQEANDLDQVVLALGRELQGLNIQFHNCGLQIVGQGGTHAERIALHANDQAVERGQASGWHEHTSVYEAWHNQLVVYRADLAQDNPYGEDNLLKAGVRSVVDVPFRHGTLALSSELPNAFWPPDIEILQAFAAAIEGAYARHLDFQRLEESNRLIEQATRHKSDFLARMSHDLRTPMNAIIGYTRILLRRAKEKLEPRQFKNLENIESSAQNLLQLINGILDLSRIEAGHVEVKSEAVDLKQLVTECATSIAPLVKPAVQLQQELAEVDVLHTDPELMRRVVMNVLGNAVKFTEAGSIRLALKTADDGIELSIADTGSGIPAEELPYIFEEFRQVNGQGETKVQEGSGLGLAIVKKTVELLGGTIAATSEVGKGTRFTLHMANYNDA